MKKEEYLEKLQKEFSYFGYSWPPLTKEQIFELFSENISIEKAYSIGSDVAAGFNYREAKRDNLEE